MRCFLPRISQLMVHLTCSHSTLYSSFCTRCNLEAKSSVRGRTDYRGWREASVCAYSVAVTASATPTETVWLDVTVCTMPTGSGTWRSCCKGAHKSLARPTSRCILSDGENISFDASLIIYINSTNIPAIMITNRIYETQDLLSLQLVSSLVGLRTYQHPCKDTFSMCDSGGCRLWLRTLRLKSSGL